MMVFAASPAMARDALGVWDGWGAFRDPAVPRCYAIAMALDLHQKARETQGYATVGTWPKRGIHGEVHIRLSRAVQPDRPVSISLGGQKFAAIAHGFDAWTADRRMDAAIIAAMRAGGDMAISARAHDGRTFRDSYHLSGAASAIDAANLGCVGI